MSTLNQPDWQKTVDLLCLSSARQILEGISFAEYRDRMEGMVGTLLTAGGVPKEQQPPEVLKSMATAVALEIWNLTPIPENRFRPRKQARPERNAPCLCGSGSKFKQCCATVDGPKLGISEALMLSKVLGTFSRKRLLELPLHEFNPDALAGVADDWIEKGRPKDAIALLEKFFAHLPQLDRRAEWAADMLLNAYTEANTPRKKLKFIEALKTAPDKLLASTGWQRQTVMLSDKGDYPAAWAAYREAQRLTPNEPALSHLEVLVLVSEGRRTEAKSRATFWAARLARDQKYDHSELIALLHDLADDSDESTLRTLTTTRSPLAQLAKIIEQWPVPACQYSLAHAVELTATPQLAACETRWMEIRGGMMDYDRWLGFLSQEPLAGQSFRILRDGVELLGILPEPMPGSNAALARRLLARGEKLRQTVLGKLKALNRELSWGFIDNRPLLTLVSYYIDEFAETQPAEALELLRWCVNIANPADNTGLREDLIHKLVAAGKAEEALAVAARYPDDFSFIEFGRVLALFAAGHLTEAEAALRKSASQSPKVWKMLNAANPKAPRMNPQDITLGGDDEAYEYRVRHLDLWRSSGALKWGAGIKTTGQPAAKKQTKARASKPDGGLS